MGDFLPALVSFTHWGPLLSLAWSVWVRLGGCSGAGSSAVLQEKQANVFRVCCLALEGGVLGWGILQGTKWVCWISAWLVPFFPQLLYCAEETVSWLPCSGTCSLQVWMAPCSPLSPADTVNSVCSQPKNTHHKLPFLEITLFFSLAQS